MSRYCIGNDKYGDISILFFCLETKEPKVQDLDLFAEKVGFLLRKSPKLGRKIQLFLCIKELPPVEQWGFLCVISRKCHLQEIHFFLTQKSPTSVTRILTRHLSCQNDSALSVTAYKIPRCEFCCLFKCRSTGNWQVGRDNPEVLRFIRRPRSSLLFLSTRQSSLEQK